MLAPWGAGVKRWKPATRAGFVTALGRLGRRPLRSRPDRVLRWKPATRSRFGMAATFRSWPG